MAKGVAKIYGRQAAEKRRFGEVFSKLNAKYFCLRKLFWEPLYTTCKSEHRVVIRTKLGKEGAELVRGERGGEGAGQLQGVKG